MSPSISRTDDELAEELEQRMLSRDAMGTVRKFMEEGLRGFIGCKLDEFTIKEIEATMLRVVTKALPYSEQYPVVKVHPLQPGDEDGQLRVTVDFGVTCRNQ